MPKTATAPEFAVSDSVLMEFDGNDVPVTIKKIKSNGNYLVEDDEGTAYECEPNEIKAAKKKKKVVDEDEDETPTPKKKKVVEEEDEDETPTPKKKKVVDEDEDEVPAPKKKKVVDEDEDDETPAPKKKKPADEDEDETPAAKPKIGGWGKQKPAEQGAAGFPIGSWEALAYTGAAEAKGKGIQAYIEYVGVHDEDVNGKTQRAYYTLKDEKGAWTEGVSYMKRDLLVIGFTDDHLDSIDDENDDTLIESLTKLLKKLRKMEPWVSIKVKDGKNGYTKMFLNGLMDDQEDKPENPLASK